MSNYNYPKNKKRIILVIIISGLVFLGFASTYSFINILGNTKNQNISAETGTLSLVFEDGNPSIKGELEFGSNIVKTFTIENTGTLDATAVMYFDNLINTYTIGSLTYTLSYSETEDGEYSEIVTKTNVPKSETNTSRTLSNVLTIPSKQKYYYNLTITLNYLEDVDQTNDFNAIFMSNFKLVEKGNRALDTLYALGLNPKVGSPNFQDAAVTDETADGLYSIDDDYGISYYFRGAVENNYVKFAGYYWRIARINGDGSLRLVYDGSMAYSNGTVNADRVAFNSKWNTTSNDAKYVGYMYGGLNGEASTSKEQAQRNETDSEIKVALDAWYKSNIVDKNYDMYIADNIFCNDRKTSDDLSLDAGLVKNTGLGYGNNATVYEAVEHLNDITVKCEQKNDRFTVNDTDNGNGNLTYPVGLLSLDEFVLAGSGYSQEWYKPSNTQFYLYKGVWQWTMTPNYFGDYNTGLTSFLSTYYSYYNIDNDRSYSNNGVAPVINIKADYIDRIVGNGTSGNPYRFEEQEFKVPDAVRAIKNNKVPKNVNEGEPNLSVPATKDEGIYAMEDDYGTSYYFRGAVDNNYVKFAGHYWRIIRINGDGSLRLFYDGTVVHKNGESSTDRTPIYSYFNSNGHDAKHVGYMYGGAEGAASTSKEEAQTNETDSNAKKLLDGWYKTNIADKGLNDYISDTLFCNDRSTASETNSWTNGDTTLGYGTNVTAYGSYHRLVNFDNTVKEAPTATLKCSQKNDRFTVDDTSVGNGDLTYPVGMITGDEVLLAGSGKPNNLLNSGGVQANSSYYLYKGHQYWTMTPGAQYSDSWTDVVKVWENGVLKAGGWSVPNSFGIAPVINIKTDYAEKMIGNGTATNPYRIEELEFKVPDAVRAIKNNQTPKNVNEGEPDLSVPATKDEGIYAMEDDYGTSYYFRGAVDNNYVKFAGFYWRIIRINGDGSLRLFYDGTMIHKNGESSTDRTPIYSYFNSNGHDAKNLGYMYGGTEGAASTSKEEAQTNETDSNAKKLLDEWYKTNIADKGLGKYMSDTLFCNDRSTAGEANSWFNGDTTLGYGTNVTFYGNSNRLLNFNHTIKDSPTAVLTCLQKNDRFTVDDTSVGNGDLTYPVGMITGDEVLLAGSGKPNNQLNSGGVQANTSYYLYKGHQYWTMTPGSQYSDSWTDMVKVWENGVVKGLGWSVVDSYGISPVINIASKYADKMTGTGYLNDPYIVE